MTQLPIFPPWEGLHPLIIHFPIAFLLAAPLLMIMGALLPPARGRPFLVTGFMLLFLGSVAIFFAAGTGEAAAQLASQTPEIKSVLTKHEDFAQTTEVLFSGLTLAFAVLLFVPKLLRRELEHGLQSELLAAFLIFYLAGALLLVNTAYQGARLVYEFRVTAPMNAQTQSGLSE